MAPRHDGDAKLWRVLYSPPLPLFSCVRYVGFSGAVGVADATAAVELYIRV